MGSTFNTVVNFGIKAVLERAKRIQSATEIMKKVDEFEFARNGREKNSFVPTELLTNDEIEEVVATGWNDVKELFLSFGKYFLDNPLVM